MGFAKYFFRVGEVWFFKTGEGLPKPSAHSISSTGLIATWVSSELPGESFRLEFDDEEEMSNPSQVPGCEGLDNSKTYCEVTLPPGTPPIIYLRLKSENYVSDIASAFFPLFGTRLFYINPAGHFTLHWPLSAPPCFPYR